MSSPFRTVPMKNGIRYDSRGEPILPASVQHLSAAYARGLVNGAVMVAWWRYRSGLRDLDLPLAANAERRQALRQLLALRRALRGQV